MSECSFCALIKETDHPARIIEFPNSVALLHVDQTYPGWATLITRQHFDHPHEMPDDLALAVMGEVRRLAAAQWQVLKPARLNYACLGNMVAHVHWHLIPRYQGDPNWGDAPWPIAEETRLDKAEYVALAARLRSALASQAT